MADLDFCAVCSLLQVFNVVKTVARVEQCAQLGALLMLGPRELRDEGHLLGEHGILKAMAYHFAVGDLIFSSLEFLEEL